MTALLLEARGVSKTYGRGTPALREVDLSLARGEALAIVGESGSGKSTLLRLLAGLEAPTSGAIAFCGRPLSSLRGAARQEFRHAVQVVFQDPFASLNPVKSIEAHLARPLRLSGHRGTEVERRVGELLESVGLDGASDFRGRYPHELSGGQRQRVAIARALAREPQVLLADEPTSMLDVSIRASILDLLTKARRDRGFALVVVTHDVASARYVAPRLCVMHSGYVVERGATDALLERPLHPYTDELLAALPGSPSPRLVAQKPSSEPFDAAVGCPLRGRCPRAIATCQKSMPEWTRHGEREVRCHVPLSTDD